MFEVKFKAKVIGVGTIDGLPQVEFESWDNPGFHFSIPMQESEVVKFKLYEQVTFIITGKGWGENNGK
jgi:hypothetical protein